MPGTALQFPTHREKPPSEDVLDLFREHGPALVRFCRSMAGTAGDAEDIVQDTFIKLLQHLDAGGGRSNLRAWLFQVAANACRDRVRRRARWIPWRVELDTRVAEPADAAGEDDPARRRARIALKALPDRDRLLLSLRAEGLSYRDIAAASGVAEASIGRLLARAVERWTRAL
jgi:RNA polymerase sigma-70 factor (ECF subfamily)